MQKSGTVYLVTSLAEGCLWIFLNTWLYVWNKILLPWKNFTTLLQQKRGIHTRNYNLTWIFFGEVLASPKKSHFGIWNGYLSCKKYCGLWRQLALSDKLGKTNTCLTNSRMTCFIWYEKGKTILDLMRQEMMGFWNGSGMSWTMCKQCALCSRQITTPAVFKFRMLLFTPNQQSQSTEGKLIV